MYEYIQQSAPIITRVIVQLCKGPVGEQRVKPWSENITQQGPSEGVSTWIRGHTEGGGGRRGRRGKGEGD